MFCDTLGVRAPCQMPSPQNAAARAFLKHILRRAAQPMFRGMDDHVLFFYGSLITGNLDASLAGPAWKEAKVFFLN